LTATCRIPILTTTKTQGSFIRHGLSQRKCETEALIQIIAGSDTTATIIRVAMLYLMSTPRAYRALQAEIDAGIRSGRVSSPVTSAEAQDMPYLQVSHDHSFSPFTTAHIHSP
jgi:cytochrome P450